jgi:hypothetical protein
MLNSESLVKFLILSAGLVICSKIYCFWSQELTCSDTMWKFEKNNKMIKRIDILFLLYMSVYISLNYMSVSLLAVWLLPVLY